MASAGSDFVVETPMCSASQHYTYPKRAENQDSKYRFIINLPEKDIVQAVRVRNLAVPLNCAIIIALLLCFRSRRA